MNLKRKKEVYLHSHWLDGLFIIAPPFLCLLVVICFPSFMSEGKEVNEVSWIILVLMIDVAHVYSTLFRTYLDAEIFATHKTKLTLIPIFVFVLSVLLYANNALWFWRIMAYVAVFHFVRQQYGFMRLYSRFEPRNRFVFFIDGLAIYTATLFPILFWHLKGDRNFEWFIEHDFFDIANPKWIPVFFIGYIIVWILYLFKEVYQIVRFRMFNLYKNLLVLGTAISWYFGIVHFNGDLAFTLFNVVAHGLPYMALVWIFGKKRTRLAHVFSPTVKKMFTRWGWLMFLAIIFLLAFLEEGFWNALVWHEPKKLFGGLKAMQIALSKEALNIIVPLLALPQITHYVVDGFVWRLSKGHQP